MADASPPDGSPHVDDPAPHSPRRTSFRHFHASTTWQAVSGVVAVALAIVLGWGLYVMGGAGALFVGMAALLGAVGLGVRHRSNPAAKKSRWHQAPPDGTWTEPAMARAAVWDIAKGLAAAFVVWNLISFGIYVRRDNGDDVSQKMATWARDHGLGHVIDYLEAKAFSTPPSKDPAKDLAVSGGDTTPGTTPSSASATTAPTSPGSTVPSSDPGATTPGTTATTVAGPPPPQAPTALKPLFSPSLKGEGVWVPIANAGGHTAMWVTGFRPFPAAGGVVGTMVVIDQTHTRVGLFNGSEEPGGTWKRGNKVPTELWPALIAAMNGGFRLQHIQGGYVTEGKVVKPLKNGDATMAVSRDGHLTMGQLGRDLKNDGSWISLRQNLVLIVDNSTSMVAKGIRDGVWWGADYGNKVYVNRSGLCQRKDGRLAYAVVGLVDAEQFAQSLINMGCVKAMQLDINKTWPQFLTYGHAADGTLSPHYIDNRMGHHEQRYLTASSKEFIAFFDAPLVPKPSVLDT